jgi:hypothetical protein
LDSSSTWTQWLCWDGRSVINIRSPVVGWGSHVQSMHGLRGCTCFEMGWVSLFCWARLMPAARCHHLRKILASIKGESYDVCVSWSVMVNHTMHCLL